ncbi:hypothetical protein [Synechococcus elongatus]|uniref:Uncharacterized protein n=2 Tax=Synechococcus elongatus TaxID=32046 RepID=A0AAN1QPQ9_SYNEL|nr:hypothetical protein [Synechococcus elongatus]AZB73221.1 hypothetical protein DOP62_11290 [Synechococcus elongatus PCC 11801]QFZ92375.1 hypothetical protein EKO22_08445 [Synechococcus elongatus PCC 11802]
MALDELTPLWERIQKDPIAFGAGLLSAVLQQSPQQEPWRSWLASRGASTTTASSTRPTPIPFD